MNCPVCDARAVLAVYKRHHPYFQCFQCGAVFTPAIDPAVLVTENDNPAGRNNNKQFFARLICILAEVKQSVKESIDFGCGHGGYVDYLNRNNWHCRGIDVDTKLQLPAVATSSIDAINMVEVLEHLSDPAAIFYQFHRVLRPGGIVYVETSLVDCPYRNLESWEYLDPAIGHRCVHSTKSLAYLAEHTGFDLKRINDNVWIFKK